MMTPDHNGDEHTAELDDVLALRTTWRVERERAKVECPEEPDARVALCALFPAAMADEIHAHLDAALGHLRLLPGAEIVPEKTAGFTTDLLGFIRAHFRMCQAGWTPRRLNRALELHLTESAADGELRIAAAVGWELETSP